MTSVFVLDKRKKRLTPCTERRARMLLSRGRVQVRKLHSFTIRLLSPSEWLIGCRGL
ncbi:MAG: RRXRR domain-containing protein [Deltaproteobacteria bacterium]|nr:RRXRR domain-containing protein [Deltaproteobacteria bacterium]